MNFQDLYRKIAEMDQPVGEELKGGQKKLDVDKDGDIEADDLADLRGKKVDEELVDECGMGPMSGPQDQQDNVNMSVNMSGSGSGGIRDLLDILRNIESSSDDMGADDLGAMIGAMDKEPIIGSKMAVDEFANEPDEMYAPTSAVTPTGDDLHSKGGEAPKVNGGGNPMSMESLISRLSNHYNDVKSR